MKTIQLTPRQIGLRRLLDQAKHENVLVRSPDGQEFIVAELDDFDREIQLARQNAELMAFLDARGRKRASIGIAELRKELGLKKR